uniref:Uncharacterized protein n=1 Tax=Oryza punctata TaxID=4537 RepID=A0A0E0LH78_ORYPU
MRYLAGKLRAPVQTAALRRPRSLSANASQGKKNPKLSAPYRGGRSNASTEVTSSMNVARNTDGELGWVQEEVAKLEELSRDIEEAIRYNRFHKRCIMASVVVGFGLGGLSCVWYARSYKKALMELATGFEVISAYAPRTPK